MGGAGNSLGACSKSAGIGFQLIRRPTAELREPGILRTRIRGRFFLQQPQLMQEDRLLSLFGSGRCNSLRSTKNGAACEYRCFAVDNGLKTSSIALRNGTPMVTMEIQRIPSHSRFRYKGNSQRAELFAFMQQREKTIRFFGPVLTSGVAFKLPGISFSDTGRLAQRGFIRQFLAFTNFQSGDMQNIIDEEDGSYVLAEYYGPKVLNSSNQDNCCFDRQEFQQMLPVSLQHVDQKIAEGVLSDGEPSLEQEQNCEEQDDENLSVYVPPKKEEVSSPDDRTDSALSNTVTRANLEEEVFQLEQTVDSLLAKERSSAQDMPASDITVITFDIETTGFKLFEDRIVEFAARDLAGGEFSTIQTLVNPERSVPSHVSAIHGISTEMVNKPDIPTWKQVALILIKFVESRRQAGGPVLLVAHNGKRFDVPFIIKEFQSCSLQIPSWWQFVDTLPLAREAMKGNGLKRPQLSLSTLHEHYNLPFTGRAHRALSDVHMLSSVLQRIMADLKMPASGLLEKAFTAEDIISSPRLQGKLEINAQDELECESSSFSEGNEFLENECATTTPLHHELAVALEERSPKDMEDTDAHGIEFSSEAKNLLEESRELDHTSTFPSITNEEKDLHSDRASESTDEKDGSFAVTIQNILCSAAATVDSDVTYMTPFDSNTSSEISKFHVTSLQTGTVDVSQLSSMMTDYLETKQQRPNFLLLSRVGDFYEAFFEDAERLAGACNVCITEVDGGQALQRKVPMAGVPYHKIDLYLRILLSKGISIVKQDQVEIESTDGKLLERKVTAILTPGTIIDEGLLEKRRNNYLVAVMPPQNENSTWGLAYSDISTGEFFATQAQGRRAFAEEILQLQPSEIIFPADVLSVPNLTTTNVHPGGLPPDFCYSCRPASNFYPKVAMKKLHICLGADALEGLGLIRLPLALGAAGALIGYVMETHMLSGEEFPLKKLRTYSRGNSMHMDGRVIKHLELIQTVHGRKYEGSLLWSIDHTETAMGGRMLRKWLLWPLLDVDEISSRLNAVEILVDHNDCRAKVRGCLSSMNDLERLACRVAWKQATNRDQLALAQSLGVLPDLSAYLEKLPANPFFSAVIGIHEPLMEMVQKVQVIILPGESTTTLGKGRLVKDNVDDALDVLRKEVTYCELEIKKYEKQEQERTGIPSLEVAYNKLLGLIICTKRNKLENYVLPDDYEKVKCQKDDDRYTTSSLLEFEKRWLQTMARANEREEELLAGLTEEMLEFIQPVQKISQALAAIDILSTYAELASTRGYCKPQVLEDSREITIVGGRHPVVEMFMQDKSFIANSLYMGYLSVEEFSTEGVRDNKTHRPGFLAESNNIRKACNPYLLEADKSCNSLQQENIWPRPDLLLLTGPESSGKSCYLRQIGLIQILAQAGSFVPARKARVGIADAVYTRVGAVADSTAGQGTFKAEMMEFADILSCATSRSLVLLDGIGRGTCLKEGRAISRAMIEYLSQHIKARTLFSTHFHQLHVLDKEFPNIANFHFGVVETEDGGLVFKHSVQPGFAMQSHAVNIGRIAGLPEWVCRRATEVLLAEEIVDSSKTKPHEVQEDNFSAQETYMDEVQTQKNVADSENKSNNFIVVSRRKLQLLWRPLIRGSSRNTEYSNGSLESNASAGSELTNAATAEALETKQQEYSLTKEELDDIWQLVCNVLQAQPATRALAKQKGSLLSITNKDEGVHACVGASALFVKKFQQYEHAKALECAFASVLQKPVHLEISIR